MRLLPRLIAILGLFGPLAGPRPENAQAFLGAGDTLQLMTTPDGLILDWQVPEVEVNRQADGTVLIDIPGYDQLNRPGAPRLPFTAVLVAIPAGASPSLEIQEIQEKNLTLPGTQALGYIPQGVTRSPDGTVIGGAFAPPNFEEPFDPEPVSIELLGVVRGVNLARVVFYPVRGEGERLQLATELRVAVHFNGIGQQSLPGETGPDSLLMALQSTVANPGQIQPEARTIMPSSQEVQILAGEQPFAAVEVGRRGLTTISYEALAEAGIQLAEINPLNLRITHTGAEIPYEWEGDGDPEFEPGERILFYAEPRFSRWTPADVYFLTQAQTPAPAMGTRSGDPTSLPSGIPEVEALFEENRIYTPDCFCAPLPPGRDGDRWVWDDLHLPSQPSAQYEFELASVDEGQSGNLTVWLIGFTDVGADPDHKVSVTLNGTFLGELVWNGKQAISTTLSIPPQVLISGLNTLTLSLPGISGVSVEGVWLDAFTIQFSRDTTGSGNDLLFFGEGNSRSYHVTLESASGLRAYDVTDPYQPVRLTGVYTGPGNVLSLGDPAGQGDRAYYVTNGSGISSPSLVRKFNPLQMGADLSGADYLVIAHPDFIPALASLVELRQNQGWKVHVEDVRAIYDAYGEGRPEPAAIRAYLETAYLAWETRPVYVLLVGDGTYDPKQYLSSSSPTFVPPFLAEVDPWAGETASDNRFVTLEGVDNLPDMLVGRLPVNSPEEAQAVVDKIVRYEVQPALGSWPGNGIWAADDSDNGGDFPVIAESLLDSLNGSPIRPLRYYYLPYLNSAEAIRQDILSAWNAGSSLALYTGHASIQQWGVEQFLHQEDVSGLHNGYRLPMVLEMTCFTSSFHIPGFATLDESLVRHPGGGAIATWGATGLGIATGHATLAETFFEHAVGESEDFGSAALAAKLELSIQNPDHLDLVDTFVLLGDPATKLNLVVGEDLFYLPLIQQ